MLNRYRLLPHAVVLILLCFFASTYYSEFIHDLPFGLHSWAQADRLALAYGFYDNGLDFFHPATNSLNSVKGIVGVEFPLQAYVAAALAKIFGRDQICAIFRLEDIILAITGLYLLFCAAYAITRDLVVSMFAPLFIFCSPVFVFYSSSFIPDPAAASLLFIAFYFLISHHRTGRFASLLTSIAIATLAVLIKSSTIPYLAGILFYGAFLAFFKTKKYKEGMWIILAGVCAALLMMGNLHHINQLNKTYNSTLFLSSVRPFDDWAELQHFLENEFKNGWMHEYFLLAQYPLYIMLLAFGWSVLLHKSTHRKLLLPIPVFLIGAISLFLLFGKQFPVHDYYFIALFLPFTTYGLVVAMVAIRSCFSDDSVRYFRVGLIAGLVMTFCLADFQIHQRMKGEQGYYEPRFPFWLHDGASLLDSLHVPASERIVIADESAPNLGLVYFDRKGYNLPPENWDRSFRAARDFMDPLGVKMMVMKDEVYHDMLHHDSTAKEQFSLLCEKEGKVVLRRN